MDAAGAIGACAVAEGDAAPLKMAEELVPFVVGRAPVFFAGTQGAAASNERAVPVDGFLWIDGLVSHRGVDVLVPQQDLSDVRRHPVHDGVGGEDSAEVVGHEVERLARVVGDPSVGEGVTNEVADAGDGIGRFSSATVRWNSSGIGGFQVFSYWS